MGPERGDVGRVDPERARVFVWYDWLMIAELDALDDNAVVRRNTWGLDLAGLGGAPTSITAAAGIGGLLAVQDESADEGGGPVQRDLVYFYDGNGNVGQVVRSTPSGPFAARYEYDAYGNVVSSQDWYAEQNPWRFSTRYADDDTDLLYYGHRYYHAGRGEWLNHEPLGEAESLRLRTFVRNAPTRFVDVAGMYALAEGDGDRKKSDPVRPNFYGGPPLGNIYVLPEKDEPRMSPVTHFDDCGSCPDATGRHGRERLIQTRARSACECISLARKILESPRATLFAEE